MSYVASGSVANIAVALAKAQATMRGAAKDRTNPHFKAKYADLASVWDACRESLTANDLAVVQPVAADGNTVIVTTVLIHKSGEFISSELRVAAQQNTPQAIGSAITYARRYGLSSMVGVAPEDDDGEAATSRNFNSYRQSVQSMVGSEAKPEPTAVSVPDAVDQEIVAIREAIQGARTDEELASVPARIKTALDKVPEASREAVRNSLKAEYSAKKDELRKVA
jgi:hypothetical protein